MTRSLGRRSGAVVLLTALLAVLPASPAFAEPVIAIDTPRDGQTHDSSSVSFAGRVSNNSPLHNVKTVTLAAAGKTDRRDCTDTPCAFSWRVDVPANGPYILKVTAAEAAILLGTPGATVEQTRTFKVAAPPATPTLDPPRVNDGRNVDLSWSRNTEPDILHYAVFRRDPGSSEFRRVGGDVSQPDSGKVRYTDTGTSAFNGGSYAYLVVAVRKGADGTARTTITSEPSGAGTASVPPPPTSSTAAPAPGTPLAPGQTTTTAKPGQAGGVDLSGFLTSRSQPAPVTPITIPEPPDTGFRGSLPFGAVPPGDELEEGPPDAVPPRSRGGGSSVITSIDSGRPLVPVAAGLVLLLLAMHLRLLNRRIKALPAGDLPVDAAPPAPAPTPPPVTLAAAEEPPRATLYDVLEEEDWDEEWAPEPVDEAIEPDPEPVVEPEPEPEPEPVALWAPPELGEEPPVLEDAGELDELDEIDELEDLVDFEEMAPEEPEPVEEEIEVFEVVSPTRGRLARTGAR